MLRGRDDLDGIDLGPEPKTDLATDLAACRAMMDAKLDWEPPLLVLTPREVERLERLLHEERIPKERPT